LPHPHHLPEAGEDYLFDALVVGADVEFDFERGPEGLRALNIQRLEA